MKYTALTLLSLVTALSSCHSTGNIKTLKDHFKDDFLIGAAIPVPMVNGLDPKADSIVTLHYNSIVAENCMKSEKINPAEGVYFWDDADAFVEYGEKRGMAIIGHTLVWHSQLAPWFPYDSVGNYVTPEVLKQRLRTHIHTLVGRYKGRVKGWDVVNEAILDNGKYRKTPFYEILGEEFIPLAFQYAHEADPEAELYLNDFSMSARGKRDKYVEIIKDLKARGLRIDGIGMQGHMGMDYPNFKRFEQSIEAFASTGVNVMITEWDLSALPTVHEGADIAQVFAMKDKYNPYVNGLPDDVAARWDKRVTEFFNLLRRHSDVISRVTVWGTHDGMTWRNNFPMPGRTDYPLPFGRDYKLKGAFEKMLNSK